MLKKNNYLTCFIFFCSFNLLVCGEPEPVGAGAGCFWPLGARPGAARKKYQEPEPEPLGKKIRSRGQLKKKSGAGAA